jgi:hypothetical protein
MNDPDVRLTDAMIEASAETGPILSVKDLRTHFFTDQGVVRAVDGVTFHVMPARRSASSASPARAKASRPNRSSG